MEAAAQVVVDAAARHGVERRGEHRAGACRVIPLVRDLEEEEQVRRGGELGGVAEAAVLAVEAAGERLDGAVGGAGAGRHPGGLHPLLEVVAHGARHLLGLLLDLRAAPGPGLGEAGQHGGEAGPAVAVLGGEVGAGVERLELRGEEDRVRPAAVPGEDLGGGHVDLVEVRPLLAVELDVDEVAVHRLGDRRVRERLPLHHVAPEAGRIADREEDRLLLAAGARERLLPPRVPVDRVVPVEAEIRAALPAQPVGGACLAPALGLAHPASSPVPARGRLRGTPPTASVTVANRVSARASLAEQRSVWLQGVSGRRGRGR